MQIAHVNTALELVLTAEQSVVGMLMDRPGQIPVARSILMPERFEDAGCRVIYQAILDSEEDGEDVSMLSIAERLERNGTLTLVGGFPYVVSLAQNAPVGVGVESYARRVDRNGRKAALARVGQHLIDAAARPSLMPADIAKQALEHLRPVALEADEHPGLLLSIGELHARHEAQSWAVKSIIPENAVGMFFGASGTFKSFLALDYALHRCYGMPWIGRKTKKGTPVYLAAEGGAGLMRRIEAWHRMRGMDWKQCPMRVVIVPLELMTKAHELREAIEALKIQPSDIIVDTMSQTYAGEENSSTDVATYLRVLGAELREPFNATVLVIHHSGHTATERPRGSSAIIANTDFLFGVYRDEKEMVTTFECFKQKDGDRWGPVSFALHHQSLGTDSDGDEVSSLVARHVTGAAEIIAAASKTGTASGLTRLLEAIGNGAPEKDVRARFYELMDDADSEAKKKAWQRAMGRALSQGLATRNGDWIDPIKASN